MFKFLRRNIVTSNELLGSRLHDQNTFYPALLRDLSGCAHEVIIESPFITRKRITQLIPVFIKLRKRNVRVIINTRNPEDHDEPYRSQAYEAIAQLHHIGVVVLFTGGHHRKLAILDKVIIWEGSLNILSYNDSCEIMRRTNSIILAEQMLRFLHLERF
jgi:phosphatidylserine/phosphatidylglycerophosphate/cardiolipin synthase-like enzyme